MGGKAFASGPEPLSTPRMPVEIYNHVRERTISLLSKYFEHIDSPKEAPEKTSYGDVDILVANPTSTILEPRIKSLAEILGATRWISEKPVMNFALPYPVLRAVDKTDTNHSSSLEVENEIEGQLRRTPWPLERSRLSCDGYVSGQYVQVDIQICETYSNFAWQLFHQAHGDLWNILGSMIRSQGITVNDAGLHLRIPELEAINRKKSMIFLSSDPDQVLKFLGLEKEKWWEDFGSIKEMFEYATTCRFFYVRANKPVKEDKDELENAKEEDKSLLKANDRKRCKQRPVFKQWIEEYIPELRHKGLFLVEPMSREEVMEIALGIFGDSPKAEYQSRLADWEREKQMDEVLRTIKDAVPMPVLDGVENIKNTREWHYRSATIKALKAIIMDGSTEESVVPEESLMDGDRFYDCDKVRSFVEKNHKKLGDIKWAKLQKAAEESTAKKAQAKAEAKKERSA